MRAASVLDADGGQPVALATIQLQVRKNLFLQPATCNLQPKTQGRLAPSRTAQAKLPGDARASCR